MNQNKEKLNNLDKISETFLKEGKYLESLETMEEALNIRRVLYGEESQEYNKTCEKLCELCNMLSMIFLKKEKYDTTLEFLKRAEILGQNSMLCSAITYNNLATYYRRVGKPKNALTYLQQALQIENKFEFPLGLADIHLNLCAVYSQIGKHDLAKMHIMNSISLLQEEFLMNSLPKKVKNSEQSSQQINAEQTSEKAFEDRMALLAIAYHNLGVEFEYLKQYEDAIKTYQKAVNFAKNYIGEDSQIVENLSNVLASAQSQIEQNKNKNKHSKSESINSQKGMVQSYLTKTKAVYGYNDNNQTSKKSFGNMNPGINPSSSQNQDTKLSKEKVNDSNLSGASNQQPISKSDLDQGIDQDFNETNGKKWANIMTPRNILEDSNETEDHIQQA